MTAGLCKKQKPGRSPGFCLEGEVGAGKWGEIYLRPHFPCWTCLIHRKVETMRFPPSLLRNWRLKSGNRWKLDEDLVMPGNAEARSAVSLVIAMAAVSL